MASSGNLLLKLLLNTADFDKNLKKSKKEVNDFAALGSKGFAGLTSMLGKFAGAAGIAVGGFELFNKAIDSSQVLTDSWGRTIEVAKVGFDNLVYSIANADFSAFNSSLSDMAERAKAAYDAYDQLANTVMSGNFSMSLDQANYRERMMVARDKSRPMEERRAALEEARALAQTMSDTSQKIFDDSMTALKAQFSAATGADISIFTRDMIEQAFRVDAKSTSAQERAEIERQYNEYKSRMNAAMGISGQEIDSIGPFGQISYKSYGDPEEERRVIESLQREYASVIAKRLALFKMTDQELAKAMQTFLSATNTRNATSEMFSSINDLNNTMNSEAATAARAQIAATQRVPPRRTAAAPEMAGLGLGMQAAPLPDKISGITDEGEIEKERQRLIKLQESQIFAERQQEKMEGMRESVGMLGDAFGSLGNAIGGATGSMLEWVGSTAQAVQAMLPFLNYLSMQATLSDAAANSEMKNAAAKTLSAYASIPFAGVAMGLAAVASIVGVMSSLPEFAQGGIVTSRTVGVFGEAGPEAVMPLDRLNEFIDTSRREVRVTGTIKGSGKDLQVVLSNYERVRSVKNG